MGKKLLIQKKGKEKKRAIEKDWNRFANNKVKILACAHASKQKNLFNYAISRKICLCLMQNSFLAILLAMLISQKTSPKKKRNWWKMGFFRYSPAVTRGLNKVTILFQIDLFPHKKVKFAHFNTKQVCNVKKKNFQCLINTNSNFLI